MIIDPYTWKQLNIQHIAPIADDILSVRVARPNGYSYRAGQYAVMRVHVDGTPVLRQYSFASSPGNDFLEFLVQREPDGVVSNWFHDEAVRGMEIEVSQPFGSFVANHEQQPVLFIAGRVGIAPFISIVRDELAHERGGNISLLYSARGTEEFCYPDLLETVQTTFFDTKNGARITRSVLAEHILPTSHVFLCGSKQFVDSLTEQLLDLGVSREHMKRELFTLQ